MGWNIIGVVVLATAAERASSVALAGFGLDSMIEIGAGTLVLWELSCTGLHRKRRALRLIGWTFLALALYLSAQSAVALISGHRAQHSPVGIIWTASTAAVMFALAAGKTRTGREIGNPVLATEGRVTFIDGIRPPRTGGGPFPPRGWSSSTTRSARPDTSFTPPRAVEQHVVADTGRCPGGAADFVAGHGGVAVESATTPTRQDPPA